MLLDKKVIENDCNCGKCYKYYYGGGDLQNKNILILIKILDIFIKNQIVLWYFFF